MATLEMTEIWLIEFRTTNMKQKVFYGYSEQHSNIELFLCFNFVLINGRNTVSYRAWNLSADITLKSLNRILLSLGVSQTFSQTHAHTMANAVVVYRE